MIKIERRVPEVRTVGIFATAALLVACSITRPLPTLSSDNGGCRDIGLLGATLTGDANDPRVTWLVVGGGRREIIWPPGFSARFDPALVVLDRSGTVVFRAGARISGGCVAGPADDPGKLLLIRPGF